jgi:hypothetical protein
MYIRVMDELERLLVEISVVAARHGMSAAIVGSCGWISPMTSYEPGYYDDGRLLKLTPEGVPNRPLLEIELHLSRLRIYKHRELGLTERFKGRDITVKWVAAFIEANAALAQQLREEGARVAPNESPSIPPPWAPEELRALRTERHPINCSCGGVNELCARCFGSGTYTVDGLGGPV